MIMIQKDLIYIILSVSSIHDEWKGFFIKTTTKALFTHNIKISVWLLLTIAKLDT